MPSEKVESVDGGVSDRGRDRDSDRDKDKSGSKAKSSQAKGGCHLEDAQHKIF